MAENTEKQIAWKCRLDQYPPMILNPFRPLIFSLLLTAPATNLIGMAHLCVVYPLGVTEGLIETINFPSPPPHLLYSLPKWFSNNHHSFIHSFIYKFIYFIHSFIYKFLHTFIPSYIFLFIPSFIHLSIHSFINLYIHYSIHSFINLLIHYLFIYVNI